MAYNVPIIVHRRARIQHSYNIGPFCYLVCLIEFWRLDGVFLSCQPVKVVGRPAKNTELSRGVTLEIDQSPDARVCHSAV